MEHEIRNIEQVVEAARVIIQTRLLGESRESVIMQELADGLEDAGYDWAAGLIEGFLEDARS